MKKKDLAAMEKICLRCFLYGAVLLLLWLAVYITAGTEINALHSKLFDLSDHELTLLHYAGMMTMKLFIFIFFLLPWIALRAERLSRA